MAPLTPAQVASLPQFSKVTEPEGRVINRKTELINKTVVRDSVSEATEYEGKKYVKRTQLIHKYELVELVYELY